MKLQYSLHWLTLTVPQIYVIGMIWTFCDIFKIGSLEKFVSAGISRNVLNFQENIAETAGKLTVADHTTTITTTIICVTIYQTKKYWLLKGIKKLVN